MRTVLLTTILLLASLAACERTQVSAPTLPEGTLQHVVHAADVPWRACPPNLPAGCELAVLEGNPQAEGLFTVRFRVGGDFMMPPHTHPREERVTVLAGQMSVAFGRDASHEDANHFGAGDYYVNARNAIHTVWADEPSVIQITGIGPWEANFVE